MRSERSSALATFMGLLAAAGASIATSAPPEWELDKSVDGPTVFLDASHPTATFHATIQATEPSIVSLVASPRGATRDAGIGDAQRTSTVSGTIVDITLARDDESAADAQTAHSTSTIMEGKEIALGIGSYSGSCHGNCPVGVAVTFSIQGGSAASVSIDWTLTATIQGEGDTPPAGESVDAKVQ
jgi:hypothetical protein